MAFIDEIGRKISSGANKVSAQTKKMTETARINGEISANSAEIDKLMKNLGLYVKSRLINEIKDPEALKIAAQIDAYIARNEQLAAQLQAVKGIRHCVNCGMELPQNSVFCPNCGTRNDPAQQNFQQAYQQPNPQYQNVQSAQPQPEPQPVPNTAEQDMSAFARPQTESAPREEIRAGVFCTNCGFHDMSGSDFCPSCGKKLER